MRFLARDSFPPLDPGVSWTERRLQISKVISCLAHYPDTRPAGLISVDDGVGCIGVAG